jgi:hypothetical protein
MKKNTKRSRKYRKKQLSFRRGGEKKPLTNEEKQEMDGFEKVIAAFLQKENANHEKSVKYMMHYNKFIKYNDISDSREKYELMRDLTHLIIKNDAHDLFFDTDSASFEVLINKIYEYLTAFVGVDHDITIDYVKSLINQKPYIKINHDVKGYNTIHDVNNLLAYIKNEITASDPLDGLKLNTESIHLFHK